MNFEEEKFIPEPKLTWTEEERKQLIQELDTILSEWENGVFSTQVQELFLRLTPNRARVMLYRWGFYDGHLHDLLETGNAFGVSRDRIRQIETAAIRSLRPRLTRRKKWKEYL